eukprot:13314046-Alexandrium_andersonii.AAC.1
MMVKSKGRMRPGTEVEVASSLHPVHVLPTTPLSRWPLQPRVGGQTGTKQGGGGVSMSPGARRA